jgi:hypothetical protein
MVRRAARAIQAVSRGQGGLQGEAPEHVRTIQCSTDTAIGTAVLNPTKPDGNCLFYSGAVGVTQFLPPLARVVSGGRTMLVPQMSADTATATELRRLVYEVLFRMADLPCTPGQGGVMWRLCWSLRVGTVSAAPPDNLLDGTPALHRQGLRVGRSPAYAWMGEEGRAAHFPYPELRGDWLRWVRSVQVDCSRWASTDFEGVILASVLGRDLHQYAGHRYIVRHDEVVDALGAPFLKPVWSDSSREVLDLRSVCRGFVADPALPGVTADPNPLRVYFNGSDHYEAVAPAAWGVQWDMP